MKRKIYYVPGMISLILLPCMIAVWLSMQEKNTLYALEIWVFRPGDLDWNPDEGKWNLARKPPTRNYTTISISDNAEENRIKSAYAEILLREHNTLQDTLNGIHFRFTEKCRYADFVRVANMQLSYSSLDFFVSPRDVWVTQVPEKKTTQPLYRPFCSTGNMRCVPERIDYNVPADSTKMKTLIIISASFTLLAIASIWKKYFR